MITRNVIFQRIANFKTSSLKKQLQFLFRSVIGYVDGRFADFKPDTVAQEQANWTEATTTSPAFIKNKPTIPAAQVQSDWGVTDEASKSFIKNKPTIPTVPAQVQADWNLTDSANKGFIKNKPKLFTAADLATGDVPITLKDSAGKKYTLTVGTDGTLTATAQA